MVEAILGRVAPRRRESATSLGSGSGRDLILRTNATNWPEDAAPSPAVQVTSFLFVLYRSRTQTLCLCTNGSLRHTRAFPQSQLWIRNGHRPSTRLKGQPCTKRRSTRAITEFR